MSAEFAYLIADDSSGSTKIGKSKDPAARLAQLQTSSPGALKLLGALSGGCETERFLHQAFAELCVTGEWFRLGKREIEWVKAHPRWLGMDWSRAATLRRARSSCFGMPEPDARDTPTEKFTLLLTKADANTLETARSAIRLSSSWKAGAVHLLRPWFEEMFRALRDGRLNLDTCESEEEVRQELRGLLEQR